MELLIKSTIEKLSTTGITFADVRITVTDSEGIYFQDGNLRSFGSSMDSQAIGIRVLINGCWGFAGSRQVKANHIDRLIARAIDNARHGSRFVNKPVTFDPLPATISEFHHRPEIDPFRMDKAEKLDYLGKLAQTIKPKDQIVFSSVSASFVRQEKFYANTEGTYTHFSCYNTDPSMRVVSSDGAKIQERSWPGDMSAGRGGFELFYQHAFESNTGRIIKEATDLLSAPVIEDEKADIIIGNSQLALQLHESVGHATEADRIFGMEISYAGKTFIKPAMLGKYQYGSEIVNIYSDSTDPAAMGQQPVDDEGVPAGRTDIIKDGILVNQQTSRQIAKLLGLEPSSNMKASYADDFPLIRMTNFCLAPGRGTLADLIADTEYGYLVDYTKTWSIDDNRNNFQFTTEIGWKIVNGKITGIVKEPTYYGITKDFWNACDRICGPEEWTYRGTFFCGKGEPGQAMQLSHGVAPARFRNINVKVNI
ncbi:MAG: TldD/PmbA family protein [Candidatus Cloacimonetes bacterium]|nr:TldD/PmbA family protein [Candidatus Cloacimonadota bacterium]